MDYYNYLTIRGNNDELNKFKEKIKDNDKLNFSLSKFIEKPEGLLKNASADDRFSFLVGFYNINGIKDPKELDSDILCFWNQFNELTDRDKELVIIRSQMLMDIYLKYGCISEKIWCIENWALTEDVKQCKLLFNKEDAIKYNYITTKYTSYVAVSRISEMYPELDFIFTYSSFDYCSYGGVLFCNGNAIIKEFYINEEEINIVLEENNISFSKIKEETISSLMNIEKNLLKN